MGRRRVTKMRTRRGGSTATTALVILIAAAVAFGALYIITSNNITIKEHEAYAQW